jgi:hypothetical protein
MIFFKDLKYYIDSNNSDYKNKAKIENKKKKTRRIFVRKEAENDKSKKDW